MAASRPPTSKPLATPKEVAAYMQRSEGTLANWRSQGAGPPYIKAEGGVLYRWPDVEEWLDSHAIDPSDAPARASA
jgi:Helix-turn-helix domain